MTRMRSTEKCGTCGEILEIEIESGELQACSKGCAPVTEPPAIEAPPADDAPMNAIAPEPPPESAEAQEQMQAAPAEQTEAAAPAFVPEAEPETAAADIGGDLVEGAMVEEPSGDILLVIRIPDPHAANLKNRAAECSQSFEEHFKERLLFGLDNGWWI